MLLLYSKYNIDWNKIYLSVMLGLVNKSGTWDLNIVDSLKRRSVYSNRIRHTSDSRSLIEKADHIYNKLHL